MSLGVCPINRTGVRSSELCYEVVTGHLTRGCLELGCLELGPELGLDLECPLTQTECVNGWVGIG